MSDIEVAEIIEEVVSDEPIKKKRGRPKKPPQPKPPKEPKERKPKPSKFNSEEEKKAHYKLYFSTYWLEKRKQPITCPCCKKEYSSQNALERHSKLNQKCKLIKLQSQLEQVENHTQDK